MPQASNVLKDQETTLFDLCSLNFTKKGWLEKKQGEGN